MFYYYLKYMHFLNNYSTYQHKIIYSMNTIRVLVLIVSNLKMRIITMVNNNYPC